MGLVNGDDRREAMVRALSRRWVWLSLVVVVAVVGAGVSVRGYLEGGGRLRLSPENWGAPVQVGTEFHLVSEFSVLEGAVRLRSVGAISDPGLDIVATVVRLKGGNPGSLTGPLPPGYEGVSLARSLRLPQVAPGTDRYAIDLRVIPRTEGVHRIHAIIADYDAGRLRHRTSKQLTNVCVEGLPSRPTSSAAGCYHHGSP